MNYGFIYETTNNLTGMKYIGQHKRRQDPNDPDDSWYLGSGLLLCKDINKYGSSNFSRRILCECESDEDLNTKERYYINLYDATDSESYYNISEGGYIRLYGEQNPMFGKHHSIETRLKISKSLKGRVVSPETRKRISTSTNGKKVLSPKTKYKISLSHKGKTPWNKGIPHTEDSREKIRNSLTGRSLAEDVRLKISMANKVSMIGNANGKGNQGKVHSLETIKRQSESHKGKRWIKNINTGESLQVSKDVFQEYLDKGWEPGRIIKKELYNGR